MNSRTAKSAALATIIACVAASILQEANAAPFQNLDFESAVIGTPVNYQLPGSQALPYWTVVNTTTDPPSNVVYDTFAMDSSCISIQDGVNGNSWDIKPLQGKYSIFLQNGVDYFGKPLPVASISQTADVPAYANSLMFIAEDGSPIVSLGGTVIPMSVYSVGPAVNRGQPVDTYIGDIRAFSGEENVALHFEGSGILDDIQFSPIVSPEPSSLVLLGIGIVGVLAHYWRRWAKYPVARMSAHSACPLNQ